MSRFFRPLLTFLFFLLLFPAIVAGVQAWQAGLASLAAWQWLLLGLLPALAWIWWRHFSVLGCDAACQPEAADGPGCRQRAP